MEHAMRGRVAVVTGAGSGIGRAIAIELSRQGGIVIATDVDHEAASSTAKACAEHLAECTPAVLDVSSRSACETVVADVLARHGRLDILVNCAGIGLRQPASETSPNDVERLMSVNFFGAVYTTSAALPAMLRQRSGSIVNVTSVAGHLPNPNESAYGATKAALSMWTHGLAVDLRGTGVHAGALSPGPIDTNIWSTLRRPIAYRGKLFSPEIVARSAVAMIRRGAAQATAPRRYGVLGPLYAVAGRPMRWALSRYDARNKPARS